MKKSILLLLVLCAVLAVFSSCSKVIKNENFKTDGYILIDEKEVVPEYVMKIGDYNISFAEYRYYYLNEKADLDGGDESVWENYPEYIDILKEYTESSLIEVYSIRTLAAENGVNPDYEEVSKAIEEYKKGMTAQEYSEGLKTFHLTDKLYEYVLQGYELYSSLFDYYFGEDGTKAMMDNEIVDYLKDNYRHAKHILITPNTSMTDEEYEALLNLVSEKAKTTEDFDALVREYSEDKVMPSYGYYFTDEEMPKEFVEAYDMLAEGEVSGLVKSSHGYHVIKRLPVDTSDVNELKDVVYNQIYKEIIEKKIASIKVEYAPEYEHISPFTVK